MDVLTGGTERKDRQGFSPWSTDAWAIASIGLAVLSFLSAGQFQFLAAVLASRLPNQVDNPTWQYVLYAGPTGLIALLGVGLGWLAARKASPEEPAWVPGVAGGGVIINAVVLATCMVGMVVSLSFR